MNDALTFLFSFGDWPRKALSLAISLRLSPSPSVYAQSTQSDSVNSCRNKKNGRLELFCRNINYHLTHRKGWEAAGIAWK